MRLEAATPKDAQAFIDQVLSSEKYLEDQIWRIYSSMAWWPLYGSGPVGWRKCVDDLFWLAPSVLSKGSKNESVLYLRDRGMSIRAIAEVVDLSPSTVQRYIAKAESRTNQSAD